MCPYMAASMGFAITRQTLRFRFICELKEYSGVCLQFSTSRWQQQSPCAKVVTAGTDKVILHSDSCYIFIRQSEGGINVSMILNLPLLFMQNPWCKQRWENQLGGVSQWDVWTYTGWQCPWTPPPRTRFWSPETCSVKSTISWTWQK